MCRERRINSVGDPSRSHGWEADRAGNAAVDHLRGYDPATALLEALVRSHESVVASELTRFELLAGARPDEHDRLGRFRRGR